VSAGRIITTPSRTANFDFFSEARYILELKCVPGVRATTKLYTPATSKDNGRASSHCGLTQRDKLREKEEDGGICQFILTIDITTVKWES